MRPCRCTVGGNDGLPANHTPVAELPSCPERLLNGLLCTICLTVKNVSDLGQRPTNYVRFYGNVERQNLGCGPFTTTEAFLYVFSLMD